VDEQLVPLTGLNDRELHTLAGARLESGQQEWLFALLERNRAGNLLPEEEKALDELISEVDRVALVKARARYTLMLSEITP
jgi:hypothetical protein